MTWWWLLACPHRVPLPVVACDVPVPVAGAWGWCAPIEACVAFGEAGTVAWYQAAGGARAWPCDGADCSAAAEQAVAWSCR